LALSGWQKDTQGQLIRSSYVAKTMTSIPELLGGWLGGSKDPEGNRCLQDKVCGPDNIKYSEGMRTLFIGEDTSRRNNNYVWAFNIDTRKLSRILSVPMYAEATGLQAVDDLNGFSYIMSNFSTPLKKARRESSWGPTKLPKRPYSAPSTANGAIGRKPRSATSARKTAPFRRSSKLTELPF
jgi:hypothetical protein